MTYIVKSEVDGSPYYQGDWFWSDKRSEAKRFTDAQEARDIAQALREHGIPSRVYRVGKGLGIRLTSAKAKALQQVAEKAEKYLDYRGPTHGDWALRMDLHNALASLRRAQADS